MIHQALSPSGTCVPLLLNAPSSPCTSLCQFLLEVHSREEEVLICLQQEDRRRRRREGRGENLPIGFEVLKVRRWWSEMEDELLPTKEGPGTLRLTEVRPDELNTVPFTTSDV